MGSYSASLKPAAQPLLTMRILRSISSVKPEFGGPIEGIKQVSRIHQADGHVVEIVSLDAPGAPWVKECRLPVHALGPARGKFAYTPSLVPWLRQKVSCYDAVIVNGIWQFNSLGVFLALRGSTTPYFVFPHGMLDPWFKRTYPLKHLKKWLYWPWGEYRVLRHARAVCFTSEEERRLARQSFWLYHCQEAVVSYGTAMPGGDIEKQKELFGNQFPQTRGKRIVLFLGRIHPKTGCELLIRAFGRICTSNADLVRDLSSLHLVIAGPDQIGWLAQLRCLAVQLGVAARVTFAGMLSGDLKLGALRAAEVFALPSHQENFGIAVAEALACSVPVLISNKVNIWREVQQDNAGLVANDDEAGIFESLRLWLTKDSQEQQSFRANALRCFNRRFEIQSAANTLIQVLSRDPRAHPNETTHGSSTERKNLPVRPCNSWKL